MIPSTNPIISMRRKGTYDDPYVPITETFTVRDGRVILTEIPDQFTHVTVNSYAEIYKNSPTATQFYVDYNLGIVYFNATKNNASLSFTYKGTGAVYFPASRIWTEVSGVNVTETLADIITAGNNAISNLEDVNAVVDSANAKIAETETARQNAITATTNANTATTQANTARDSANTAASTATSATTSANTATTNANAAKANADTATTSANTAATNANAATTNANTAVNNLLHLGTYSAATTYNPKNMVTYNNEIFICLVQSVNVTPVDGVKWRRMLTVADVVTNAQTATTNANTATTNANNAETTRQNQEATRQSQETTRQTNTTNAINTVNNTNTQMSVWEAYNVSTTYKPLNKVSYNGSSYVCIVQCVGVLPTDISKWTLISSKGADGTGTLVETSATNGNVKINGVESTVYTHPDDHPASMITGLATVATTGEYSDLLNPPTVPTKTSDLENDSGFGSDSIQILALSSDITLTKDSPKYLHYTSGGTDRIINLPMDAQTGKTISIHNVEANLQHSLVIKQSTTTIDTLYGGAICVYVFDGTNWYNETIGAQSESYVGISVGKNAKGYYSGVAIGSYADGNTSGVGVGDSANGNSNGVAVGMSSTGNSSGVAVGNNAKGNTSGVSVGYGSWGRNNGVAIGYSASSNDKNYAVAKGYRSKAQRWNEEVKCSDGTLTNYYSYSTLAWHGETTNATQTELFLGGSANQRCAVLASSAFGFSIYVTAKDNVNSKGKRWKLEGMIQRNGASVTSLVGSVTKTVITQSDSDGVGTDTWDVIALADDTNEALVLKFTGETSKTIRIVARGEIEECRF